MIPESVIEEIRARAEIEEVVGEQIPLKRAGKDFRALCPFHHEKTPSFYVVPRGGFYKCFGCGESGDVFTFLMKRGGLSFQDAVRELGRRYGVDVPDERMERHDEPHRVLYETVAFAHDFFRRTLADADPSSKVKKYLADRGITAEAVERFGIGYAPDAWRALREEAHRHGIEDDVLLAAGLIKESERGDEPYDRFRDRLIFPIAELSGRVIAFGGRILSRSENAPKYLNSPETPIYHKGDVLYGLNWSKSAIRREGCALVVEGYMDYVSLAARGIEHVVAGMGTAMTEAQANLLARYTGKALMLYDSDAAGMRAAFRTADALLQTGVHPLVVTLPEGEDPDSIVRRGGAEALAPFLDGAVDVIEKKIAFLAQHGYFDDIERVRRALDKLLPTLRATVDPALRDIYIARISQRTGVRRETLERDVERTPLPRAEQPRAPARAPSPRRNQVFDRLEDERLLLKVLMADRSRVAAAAAEIPSEHLHDPRHREIFQALAKTPADQVPALTNDAAAVWTLLEKGLEEIINADGTYTNIIGLLKLEDLDLRTSFLDDAIAMTDAANVGPMLLEKHALSRQRAEVIRQYNLGNKSSRAYNSRRTLTTTSTTPPD